MIVRPRQLQEPAEGVDLVLKTTYVISMFTQEAVTFITLHSKTVRLLTGLVESLSTRRLMGHQAHLRIDSNTVRPIIVCWGETTFRGRLERAAIWILGDVTSFIVDDGLHQSRELFVLTKKRVIMRELCRERLSRKDPVVQLECIPDLRYRAATERC